MIDRNQLNKISDYLWEIPITYKPGMRVPGHVFALEEMLDDLLEDRSLEQLVNVAHLPGIQKAAIVMPDAHQGYGFPIGGVAATRYPEGAISPGGIGYDINCGVRLLVSELDYDSNREHMDELCRELYKQVPSGLGQGGYLKMNINEIKSVLRKGAEWAVEQGYGTEEDLLYTESNGRLPDADPDEVSIKAMQRGADQLGTIGSGNHFVEVGRVDQILDKETAGIFGLQKDRMTVLIHTGSRGLGHQVATDNLKIMSAAMADYGIELPDRELACVPFKSKEGQSYWKAMAASANFAWCNRQFISHQVRKAWYNVFGQSGGELSLLYDVAHNIAKLEEHRVNGQREKVIVHRKGATRSFGPGRPELPGKYGSTGQPVLIPGSMGTSSWILAGDENAMDCTFGSCCHGAGRRLSRRAAKREVNAPVLKEKLLERGIHIQAGSMKGIAEEAPAAYKDVDMVVETVHAARIARKIAQLRPLAVIKG